MDTLYTIAVGAATWNTEQAQVSVRVGTREIGGERTEHEITVTVTPDKPNDPLDWARQVLAAVCEAL